MAKLIIQEYHVLCDPYPVAPETDPTSIGAFVMLNQFGWVASATGAAGTKCIGIKSSVGTNISTGKMFCDVFHGGGKFNTDICESQEFRVGDPLYISKSCKLTRDQAENSQVVGVLVQKSPALILTVVMLV